VNLHHLHCLQCCWTRRASHIGQKKSLRLSVFRSGPGLGTKYKAEPMHLFRPKTYTTILMTVTCSALRTGLAYISLEIYSDIIKLTNIFWEKSRFLAKNSDADVASRSSGSEEQRKLSEVKRFWQMVDPSARGTILHEFKRSKFYLLSEERNSS